MPLEDSVEQYEKEENPQAQAVRELINVKDRTKNKSSGVDIKTDLTDDRVCIHSQGTMVNQFIEQALGNTCILGDLIEILERKLISRNRLSRAEIVAVAKQPEIPKENLQVQKDGFVKRWFTPRQQL